MKKLMMGLAASALLLSSCAKNEVMTNTADSNLISFSKLNDRLAKSANDENQNYGVYAAWSGGTTAFYMNGIEVDGTANTYTPAAYWPASGSMDFYAYAPFAGETGAPTVAADRATPSVLLSYAATATIADQRDFTVATPVKVTDVTTPPANVALSFNHMLCRIELGTVSLKSPEMDAFTIDATGATVKVMAPIIGGDVEMVSFDPLVSNWKNLTDKTATKADWHRYEHATGFYMMPQPSTAVLIQLKGIKLLQNGSEYYAGDILIKAIPTGAITNLNSVLTDKAADKFNRGSKYTVNFSLGNDILKPNPADPEDPTEPGGGNIIKNAITFTSSTVNWVTETMTF